MPLGNGCIAQPIEAPFPGSLIQKKPNCLPAITGNTQRICTLRCHWLAERHSLCFWSHKSTVWSSRLCLCQ